MALIKCPECGRNISDDIKKCIHCGYPLKTNILSHFSNFIIENVKYFINIILSVILFVLLANVGCVNTLHSGLYSIYEMLKWLLDTNLAISNTTCNCLIVIFLIITFISLLLMKNHNFFNVITKINLILVFIFELLFYNHINGSVYSFNSIYIFIIIYSFLTLITIFVLNPIKANNKKRKHNISDETYIKIDPEAKSDKLIKLKELLDNNLITDEEFEILKKEIMNKKE